MVAGCTEPSARPAPKEIGECQIQKVARRGAPARPMFRDSLRCSSAFSSAWRSMDATTTGWRWVRVRGDNIAGNLRRGRGDHRSEQANGQADPFKPRCAVSLPRRNPLTSSLRAHRPLPLARGAGRGGAAEPWGGGGGRPRGTTCRPRRASGSTRSRPFPSPGSTGVSIWCARAGAVRVYAVQPLLACWRILTYFILKANEMRKFFCFIFCACFVNGCFLRNVYALAHFMYLLI